MKIYLQGKTREYRKTNSGRVWHYHPKCPSWPSSDFVVRQRVPAGEFTCTRCRLAGQHALVAKGLHVHGARAKGRKVLVRKMAAKKSAAKAARVNTLIPGRHPPPPPRKKYL